MLEEKEELPQLIVIDGGKGQLSSAQKFRKIKSFRSNRNNWYKKN